MMDLELPEGVTGADLEKSIPDIVKVEKYLVENYEFIFNVIKKEVMWRELNNDNFGDWRFIEDYDINTIIRNMKHKKIKGATSGKALMELLQSQFTQKANPIQDYLKELPAWDGKTDYIQQLCDSVTVTNKEHWYLYFKKWLVASVANVMILKGCQNQTCLVLTGDKQGLGKTFFLDSLCPKVMQMYITKSLNKIDDKDALIKISQYWFINIDDKLVTVNKKDSDALKGLITMDEVKIRKPYGKVDEFAPRIASFMGSINEREYLTDSTGSRRFLSFEVLDIDREKGNAVNRNNLWAQVYSLYASGFNYWFTNEEIMEINLHNEAFNRVSKEFELLNRYFLKVTKENELNSQRMVRTEEWLTLSEIISYIAQMSKTDRLTDRLMGMALKRMEIHKVQKTISGTTERIYKYPLYKKEGDDFKDETPF